MKYSVAEDTRLENKRIKRQGKDRDDLLWLFGKIHGLENIALLKKEHIDQINGNPARLQTFINDVEPSGPTAYSFEEGLRQTKEMIAKYKEALGELNLTRSDRTKMLALPFFCHRRVQGPAPQKGQWQYELFNELSGGKEWDHYKNLEYDPEEKVNVHQYEKFFPAGLIEKVGTDSPEFKKSVKLMTLLQRTQYEEHEALKTEFRGLMNVLPSDEKAGRALIHYLRSNRGSYLEGIHGRQLETLLAKISEKENFEKKNEYRLEKLRLDYMRKERMPVEKAKVKDIFKHALDFKERVNDEIGLYNFMPRMINADNRVIQYFYESAYGPLLELRKEMGLATRWHTSFMRIKDLREQIEANKEDPVIDYSWNYFFSHMHAPVDLTDYEDHFAGPGEFANPDTTALDELLAKPSNRFDIFGNGSAKGAAMEDAPPPNFFRSTREQDEWPAPDDDDDEEGEGDEVPELEAPYREVPEYNADEYEPPEWPVEGKPLNLPKFSRMNDYFDETEGLRQKFDDIELESFMKLLDVQPFKNWTDTSDSHMRIGVHVPIDFSQRIDPEFHMAGEVEREHFERIIFRKHRTGAIVRFALGTKKPKFNRDYAW
eukprot:CAMPEP_0168318128 /NCGR_PEP_ID=MMETSP0213-20121227/293_1 /TAXON_ID=151035 /ORGANISM="Euplotes harpa, Strain FSP1.4" /LENGTH=599 /DNA_ID=CAMNT_0008319133 /DNA_START=495 /DNA_END=2294 /DNA_ORIENTATION=-